MAGSGQKRKDSPEAFGAPPPAISYLSSPATAGTPHVQQSRNLQRIAVSKSVKATQRPLWTTLRPVVTDLDQYLRPKTAIRANPSTLIENNFAVTEQVRSKLQSTQSWDIKAFRRKGSAGAGHDANSEQIRQRVLYIVGTEPTAMQDKLAATKLLLRDELFLQQSAATGHPESNAILQRHKLSKALRERFELVGRDSVQGLRVQLPQRLLDRQLNLNYLRKQYYVINGIETTTAMEIPDTWLDNILNQLEFYLIRNHPETLKRLVQDARYEFLKGIKSATAQFVFRSEELEAALSRSLLLPSVDVIRRILYFRSLHIAHARKSLQSVFHQGHPINRAIVTLWYQCKQGFSNKESTKEGNEAKPSYDDLRVIQTQSFTRPICHEPFDLQDFQTKVLAHIDYCRDKVSRKWLEQAKDLILLGQVNGWLPAKEKDQSKVAAFVKAASALVTRQIQTALTKSLNDLFRMFFPQNDSEHYQPFPGFVVRIVLDATELKFDPDSTNIQKLVLNVFYMIADVMKTFPSLDGLVAKATTGKKALDETRKLPVVGAVVLPEVLNPILSDMEKLLHSEFEKPIQFMDKYSVFEEVTSNQCTKRMESFVAETHSYEEYLAEMEHFLKLINDIYSSSSKTVYLGLFTVNCEDLISGYIKRIESVIDGYVVKMLELLEGDMSRLSEDQAIITRRLLSAPANIEELIQVQTTLDRFTSTEMTSFTQRLQQTGLHIQTISRYTNRQLSGVSKVMLDLLSWQLGADKMAQASKRILEAKTEEFTGNLMMRRDKITEDLELIDRLVMELFSNTEANDVSKYKRKANNLEARLEDCMQRIDQLNKEEALFKWELTDYPQRAGIVTRLQPFVRLYDTGSDFADKCQQWLAAPTEEINPETVVSEVESMYATIHKLEKVFGTSPGPHGIASKVKGKIEQFKEFIPLINTLCNPGLRNRHWEQVSGVVGYTLKPSNELTLSKLVHLKLGAFISQFEVISEAASKEYSIEKSLNKMKDDWKELEFTLLPYRETGTTILSAVDELQLQLDDHLLKTQTVRGSPFVKAFDTEAKVWEETLRSMQDILDIWLKVVISGTHL